MTTMRFTRPSGSLAPSRCRVHRGLYVCVCVGGKSDPEIDFSSYSLFHQRLVASEHPHACHHGLFIHHLTFDPLHLAMPFCETTYIPCHSRRWPGQLMSACELWSSSLIPFDQWTISVDRLRTANFGHDLVETGKMKRGAGTR